MSSGATSTPVKLLYFAWVREKIGKPSEVANIPANIKTVADTIAWLQGRGPEYADAFSRPHVIRTAIDQTHVKADAAIAGAREIAFFPPVTGG
jgi:sulfur-carrier protein